MMSPEVHARGLGFPEGPVVLDDGGIAFVDLLHAKIRVCRDGVLREIATLPGAPNGMRLGPDGALYVANNGGLAPRSLTELNVAEPQITGRLQRVTLDGTAADYAVDLPGEGPWRPNDLVFTPEGGIVFTDPQNWEALHDHPADDPRSQYRGGRLMLAGPDGTVRLLAPMSGFPNGLVFHPDGSLLVGSTVERRIVRFDWRGGEALGPGETWCRFDKVAPDGMAFFEDRLYVTGSVGDRIAVVDLDGRAVGEIDTGPGSDPTNLCFQGRTMWVTLGLPGQLVAYRL